MKLSKRTLFIILLIILATGFFLLREKSRKQSLADLYYGGKCFRVLTGEKARIGQSEGIVEFTGTIDNVCDRNATIKNIRIFYYSDPDYKNLVNSDRTFVPSLPSLELKSGETTSFTYTLKIFDDELHGFRFYKLVAEE